tara:strand:- start:150 stop:1022 length:873 start_codon:yes stop_codon:yes gene_type:complete
MHQIEHKIIKRNPELTGQVIFCEDGSTDDSFQKLTELNKSYNNIQILRFTRNFGQIPAILAGLDISDSKAYIVISADLQDPVELINEFLNHHFKENFEIVYGERIGRADSFTSKIAAKFFYKIISRLSFPNYPAGGFDYFLISKKVRDLVLKMNQANPFIQGEILFTGHKSKSIPYKRGKRPFGTSKWTLSKKITYFIDGIMGYSFFPLRMMSFLGLILFFISISFLIFIIISKVYGLGNMPYGWASLMVVLLFLGGIQMVFLGVLGEYLWRILSQVRNKPQYIIDEIIK